MICIKLKIYFTQHVPKLVKNVNQSIFICLILNRKYYTMAINVVTVDDLDNFRHKLLEDLKTIIQTKAPKQMQWLKSSEVRKVLKISPGTLQNLRINGTLSFTKIGSIIYYKQDDIEAMLSKNKSH